MITLVLLLFLTPSSLMGQAPRRAAKRAASPKPAVAQPTPQAAPSPVLPPREHFTPTALAQVNGQTITTADIDSQAAQEFETLEERIAEAQREALELQINSLLFDAEARRRRLSSQQLYELEVSSRINEPTEAEITNFLSENGGLEDRNVNRDRIIGYLRSQRETRLADELVKRLRTTNPVIMGTDLNTTGLAPSAVLATVSGRTITAAMLAERMKPVIYKLRLGAYEITRDAVNKTANDLLLLAEASRRNVPPEGIVRAEVTDKIRAPTDAEVVRFYNENKARIDADLDAVRNQIAAYLQEQDERRLQSELAERLRKGANIRLLISEPAPPSQTISVDDDPVQGNPSAAVTIVEFTDFQCPACAAMQPVIEEALRAYGARVKLVVRDFPLPIHANARKAAEAANAAHAQGKFFEFTTLLFKRQSALAVASLKKYASEIGLDRVAFDAALDKGTYAAEVGHDIEDGQMYGVESTPTIYVNGVLLRTLTAEALKAAIDEALKLKPNR